VDILASLLALLAAKTAQAEEAYLDTALLPANRQAITAPYSASVYRGGRTELIGGALLMLGLGTRLAAIPLCINMVVAILVVNLRKVSDLDDFVELSEPLYALCFVWLFFSGPGRASLDHLVGRCFTRPDAPR